MAKDVLGTLNATIAHWWNISAFTASFQKTFSHDTKSQSDEGEKVDPKARSSLALSPFHSQKPGRKKRDFGESNPREGRKKRRRAFIHGRRFTS